eukprot:Selendium_serpulae@DN2990_c0_g1_i2.p1
MKKTNHRKMKMKMMMMILMMRMILLTKKRGRSTPVRNRWAHQVLSPPSILAAAPRSGKDDKSKSDDKDKSKAESLDTAERRQRAVCLMEGLHVILGKKMLQQSECIGILKAARSVCGDPKNLTGTEADVSKALVDILFGKARSLPKALASVSGSGARRVKAVLPATRRSAKGAAPSSPLSGESSEEEEDDHEFE